MWLEHSIVACLIPLAAWILLSGLDDLAITLIYWKIRRQRFWWPGKTELDHAQPRRIAIFVPLWNEYRVIEQMLDRNVAAIRYDKYDIFVGVYPNDERTARAVAEAAARHPRVHLIFCAHNGPTSKGDCLNWIYREMELYEARHGVRFEIVMTHDAEDVIHPESLRLINWFSRAYDMVQMPVLPLRAGRCKPTSSLYCDEFAEFQQKDIPVRQHLGGFIPSNGVGTGFSRTALERLAESRNGRVFDPECLTEDYENGFELHAMGFPQIFLPLRFDSAGPIATREYFPKKPRAAIRQRSRWVAGIALQGWQRHGWRVPWRQVYWFWRDRKGLPGNLVTLAANLIFLIGLASWIPARSTGWQVGAHIPRWLSWTTALTLAITAVQMAVRIRCCARIYGWRFAAFAPLRVMWGNVLNSAATVQAVQQFLRARLANRKLAWLKTEHVYPAQAQQDHGRPRLGEVLVRMRFVQMPELEQALASCPQGVRLGEHLLRMRKLSEDRLYQALSRQAEIPLGMPHPAEVNRLATRILPAATARRWKVMPYRIAVGQLHVVTAELPSEELTRELAGISDLEVRFRLVRPWEFEALTHQFMPKPECAGDYPAPVPMPAVVTMAG